MGASSTAAALAVVDWSGFHVWYVCDCNRCVDRFHFPNHVDKWCKVVGFSLCLALPFLFSVYPFAPVLGCTLFVLLCDVRYPLSGCCCVTALQEHMNPNDRILLDGVCTEVCEQTFAWLCRCSSVSTAMRVFCRYKYAAKHMNAHSFNFFHLRMAGMYINMAGGMLFLLCHRSTQQVVDFQGQVEACQGSNPCTRWRSFKVQGTRRRPSGGRKAWRI
jgi:hypothetical protein